MPRRALTPAQVELAAELRALGHLEMALSALIAERVAEARGDGVTWRAIAAAVGTNEGAAHHRWADILHAPRATRQQRGFLAPLGAEDAPVVARLAEQLAARLAEREQ